MNEKLDPLVKLSRYFPDSSPKEYSLKKTILNSHVTKYIACVEIFGQKFSSEKFDTESEATFSIQNILAPVIDELIETIVFKNNAFNSDIMSYICNYLKTFNITEQNIILSIDALVDNKALTPLQAQKNSAQLAKLTVPNPVSFIHDFARLHNKEEPKYEFFTKIGLHGCKLTFLDGVFVALAVYKKKNDAKIDAAKQLCAVLFESQGLSTDLKNVTLVDSSKFFFGKTEDFVSSAQNHEINKSHRNDLTPFEICPLPDGRKFVSAVNEYCQKNRMISPNYTFSTNNNVSSIYVCESNFLNCNFKSAPFSRKSDAKEDVAARIYDHIVKIGRNSQISSLDSNSKSDFIGCKTLDSGCAKKFIPVQDFQKSSQTMQNNTKPHNIDPRINRYKFQ